MRSRRYPLGNVLPQGSYVVVGQKMEAKLIKLKVIKGFNAKNYKTTFR